MVSARTTVAAAHRALHNTPSRMRAAPPDAPCPLPPTHHRFGPSSSHSHPMPGMSGQGKTAHTLRTPRARNAGA
eukprot:1165221-Prymnesium_polylepis.1